MPTTDTTSHLYRAIDSHLASFSKARAENKRNAFTFKLLTLVLGLVATVVLGVETDDEQRVLFKNAALICTACVTFFTGVDLFYNHKALWVRYTQTVNELKAIRADLEYLEVSSASDIPLEQLSAVHDRISKCLSETNAWWLSERMKGEM